ncbi:MAG: hypothetical protein WBE82_13600, partial [Xanthobacteraceae bacterium]
MADTDEKKAKAQGKPAKGKSDKGKSEQQASRPQTAEQMAKAGKDDKKAAKQARSDKAAAGAGKPAAPRAPEERVPARLKVEFDETIRKKIGEQFGFKNRFQIPVLDKVVINMGIGEG